MLGFFRLPVLVAVAWLTLGPLSTGSWSVAADDPPAKKAEPAPKGEPDDYRLPGEDVLKPFVPKQPQSVTERRGVDQIRLFAHARALEDQQRLGEAIDLLEKARALDGDSIPILKRLSRLHGALGRIDRSIELSRKVLAIEPGDTETIVRLVEYYRDRRRDLGALEGLLNEIKANPKLERISGGYLIVHFELAILLDATNRTDKAAVELNEVMTLLDDRRISSIRAAEIRRVLGFDEADAYFRFGELFARAGRIDLAIKALQHGLVYDPDHPQIPLLLAQTLLATGKGEEALAQVERFVKRQPPGRAVYDLLARILLALKRPNEIIPRLERAAGLDSKNIPLQYALADQYRAFGMAQKADDLLKKLIDQRPDTQGSSALFSSLLKDKKKEELLLLLEKVITRLNRLDAARPQIEALAADPAFADEVLDAGLSMLTAQPPRLRAESWLILVNIAVTAKRADKQVGLLRWRLKTAPTPMLYRELILAFFEQFKYEDAIPVAKELIAKFPETRGPQTLLLLGEAQFRAGKLEDAIATARESLKLVPDDVSAIRLLSFALNQSGKNDEAAALILKVLGADPKNFDLIRALNFIYASGGRNEQALAFNRSLLEKHAGDDTITDHARSSLSNIYIQMGDYAKGEAELEILLERKPDDAGVNNDLGYLYADQGKHLEKAERMIRKAVEQEPGNASYLDSLGWVLFKRGKLKESVGPLEQALKAGASDDATVLDHLGDVYFSLQERSKARETWERAEKLAAAAKPPDRKLAEIRKKLESLRKLDASPRPGARGNP